MKKVLHIFLSVFLLSVIVTEQAFSKEKQSFVVVSPFMEVNTGAGRMQPVFLVVDKNESFDVLKRKHDWLKIRTKKGKEGWVSLREFFRSTSRRPYQEKQLISKMNWEIEMSGGLFSGENKYSIVSSYYITPAFRVGVDYEKSAGQFSSSTIVVAQLALSFYRDRMFSPYLNLGSGLFQNTPRQLLVNGDETEQVVYQYGGGLDIRAYKNMKIRFGVNDYYLSRENENYFGWRLGVVGLFL